MQNKNSHKVALGVLWLILFVAFLIYWKQSGLSIGEFPSLLSSALMEFGIFYAGIVYIILYGIRPILFFPATALTIASGILFGPWYGILFTVIGANLSANVAFLIARYLGRDWVEASETKFMKKWDQKLQKNGLVTVMIMRFIYLPFDGVNYGCGFTSMRQRDFASGSFIGMLPGTITFVLLGGVASVHSAKTISIIGYDFSQRSIVLMLSFVFFCAGLLIAKLLKQSDIPT